MKEKVPLVSIVIPTYNGKHLLAECLPSILNQKEKSFEIIVVDNGSTDNTQEFLKKRYPQIRLIDLGEKSGFAKPVNTGIKFSRGKYIALVNNDVILDQNWLFELVSRLERKKDIGFCACLMLDSEGKKVDSAGDGFSWWGRAYPIGRGEKPQKHQKEKLVFGACAGTSIFRREVFEKVDLLDEDFYAYFEDIDLSFRAQLAGFKCLYVPSAVVYHRGSATFDRDSVQMRCLGDRNKCWLVLKNYPLKYLLIKAPQLILTSIKSFATDFWEGMAFTNIKANLIVIATLPKTFEKRGKIQKMRQVSDRYLDSIINNTHPKIK